MEKQKDRKKYWKQHYDSFRNSDLTQRGYCKQNDLSYWTFNQWKRKLDKTESDLSMQEIPVKLHQKTSSEKHIEIILNNNIRLSVPDNFSSDTLKKIVSVLRENQ
jgi:tagatose-1,6-bisphosphate aldolase non-catalytic subunit AgaZ/GatZ